MKLDKFVLAIIFSIVIAYFFPQLGSEHSFVPLDSITSIGVSLIFFFYGLKLSGSKLKEGLKNWKLHLLIQTSTFLLFPLVVLVFLPLAQTEQLYLLWLAVFFMAALPSTVSSSVVMVSIAKGNIPAAIFNASISGIIGIAITPLWIGLFLQQTSMDFDFTGIYIKLATEILLPVFLGIMLQRFLGAFANRYSSELAYFDKTIILLIIYKSFAESFEGNMFSSLSVPAFIIMILAVFVLFYLVYSLVGYVSRKLDFSLEDRITAQFCGTKKSLVHGTVFSKVFFANTGSVGIVLLPLMLFHAIQILLISIIAKRFGEREEPAAE